MAGSSLSGVVMSAQTMPMDTSQPGPVAQLENQVTKILEDALVTDAIEEVFAGFIVHSEEAEQRKMMSALDEFKRFWQGLSQDNQILVLQHYVKFVHMQKSSRRGRFLFDMLYIAIENQILPPRLVCECLLLSDELHYLSADKWNQSFSLIHRVIDRVDYKGCRDLFKIALEKVQIIPTTVTASSLRQLEMVTKLMTALLNRDNCLMPAYFAVNEIRKLYSEDKSLPHWSLGNLLSEFVDTFRTTAHMVSISGRPQLLPVVGHSGATGNAWKLDPATLRFPLKGLLPYDKELFEPQTGLLRYVLEQPYSRDMVCNMLGLNKQHKQRCEVLEEQLVDLIVIAMERSEHADTAVDDGGASQLLWQHLSSQLIFFVLFQFASFPHMVLSLHEKLVGRSLRKGRDHLMWVLLQFISGSIQKNPLSDFLPVMKLYDLLYPEKESIQVPDINKPQSTHAFAMTCIWIHLNKKAQNEDSKLQRPIPQALKSQLEFLQQSLRGGAKNLPMSDYRIAVLCNAYSTNTEFFGLPMGVLVETIYGSGKTTTPLPGPGSVVASGPTAPLPMNLLDSLTVHAKMSLIHSIVTRVIKLAQTKSNLALAPALVETYSRLLVYMEIESLGIKGFISQLLPNVFKSHAWGILHTLLEMFSYRLHHIQPHYRVQLLSHLHSLAAVPQTNQNQLHLCVESTALRLITGLGSAEVQPQLSRFLNDPKQILSVESEELNRALVLTLARAMHVTGSETLSGNWCKDILTTLMANTPHNWATHTLTCFPPALQQFFKQNPVQVENRLNLKKNVEDEFRKWKSMTNENETVQHFTIQGAPPLFLCLLWKMLLESDRISPVAVRIMERIGARSLTSHIRTFADFLVYEFSTSVGGQHVNRCIEILNDMIWKYNIVTLDRLILALAFPSFQAMRSHEGNEAQVCFFIIQLLLLKPSEFRNRVNDFVKENSPEHWLQTDWHSRHMNFHRRHPEQFYFEGLQELASGSRTSAQAYLPIYFGNVCLRFLPVFDIVIHRFLELPPVSKSLETLLDHLGGLYKFHDRPVTYLYNTLHYYEKRLRDRPALKRKLVAAVIGALKDIRQPGWCLSESYLKFITRPVDEISWVPDDTYYCKLIGRLVDTISGKNPPPFPNCDWRFNEFPNPAAHALHVTCVELMALPVVGNSVGSSLLNVVLKSQPLVPRENIMSWMNAIGLVLTSLPEPYWMVLHERIIATVKSDILVLPENLGTDPFTAFDFCGSQGSYNEVQCSYVLALTHAVWHHSSIGQLTVLPQFLKDQLKPLIQTEEQFLFICHLVGPFLQRFHQERTRCLLEITVELYEMLHNVDKHCEKLLCIHTIADFLYHVKYMFTGDGVKNEVERIIRTFRPELQKGLRYITHISKPNEASTSSAS
ncbi:mediator of RNA polymerase II transcription subunit 23-like [Branchiostoma lanceolatum]|uniref:mediator of RNA polymerase II transcription subunit 23-like n=1 Tax=Branchiostoma lanceolatum TaxID=7740 RepID=UPI003454EDB8